MPRGVWVAQGWQSTHVKYRTEGGVVRQLFLQLQIDLVAQLTNIKNFLPPLPPIVIGNLGICRGGFLVKKYLAYPAQQKELGWVP